MRLGGCKRRYTNDTLLSEQEMSVELQSVVIANGIKR